MPPVLAAAGSGKFTLVHGCSRGLGLEFVNQLLQRPSTQHVFAACRTPSPQLLQLQAQQPQRITVLPLDASDEHSIQDAVERVSNAAPYLNLLINAVGVLHIPGQMMPGVWLEVLCSFSAASVCCSNQPKHVALHRNVLQPCHTTPS